MPRPPVRPVPMTPQRVPTEMSAFPKRERPAFSLAEPRPRPESATKSPDELKMILRTMTAKTGAERVEKQTTNQQSLKGALAAVLERSAQKAVGSRQETQKPDEEEKSEAALPPRANPPVLPTEAPEKKPFEIPEDTLRRVLKGDT